ncbi:hypothetical protein [Polaromonas sp.]|uniref:hypothetical protein n=1 Tax=Polaromonas sp. TaxID=1869339 RepID=UPI001A33D97A|nr:hypothetical protein [Burkholderiales bacterium]MBH2018082.1 hypothetical protein [Burkholderiales bacterium]
MTSLITTALLGLIEQAGTAIATLTEGLERNELLRSRLTRTEVLRQLKLLADSVAQLEPAARSEMPELDWSGWDAMCPRFSGPPGEPLDDALWFACESLVPATLLWLRVYQQSQPMLFRMTP